MCSDACQRQKSLWPRTGREEPPMWHKVASLCETQPQQGSVTSHQLRREHWRRYLFKNCIDLFQKKSFRQSLRHHPAEQPIEVDDEDMQGFPRERTVMVLPELILQNIEVSLGSSTGYGPEHSSTSATTSPDVLQQQPMRPHGCEGVEQGSPNGEGQATSGCFMRQSRGRQD